MASGAIPAGGYKADRPGGQTKVGPGGISYSGNHWRAFSGHDNSDPFGPVNSSGARVTQTRGVRNIRRGARTTSVTFAWTLPTIPGGSTTAVGSITGGSTATASFTPDVAGTYVFRCVVTYVKAAGSVTQTFNFTYVSA